MCIVYNSRCKDKVLERKIKMELKDVLIKSLPKKCKDRVQDFYFDDGLIDGCIYMLVFNPPYQLWGYESVPVKNIDEAKLYVKHAIPTKKH